MKKKLLIIEDIPETLALLKWRAERSQFECILDDSGAAWIEKVALEKPDAVLFRYESTDDEWFWHPKRVPQSRRFSSSANFYFIRHQ